jgi:spore coat protein A
MGESEEHRGCSAEHADISQSKTAFGMHLASTARTAGRSLLLVPLALAMIADAHVLAAPGTLNYKQVPQFVNVLPNPLDPSFIWQPDVEGGNTYTLEIREFTQSLGLGAGVPATRVWGYSKAGQSGTFPGRTFELQQGQPITVSYVNTLIDGAGNPLPNRMPVDTTLDWANPGTVGGITPVPVVAHLHGGDSAYRSDGLPEAWDTPDGQTGPLFDKPYTYDNKQESGTLWYHDHALGITRTNVYMGLAGFYLLRDANEDTLRETGVLPSHPYEVPIVIQDREFDATGQLLYPVGKVPVNSALPEFFGRLALVNGQAWPKLDVEKRKYRLRLLNGSDSRFYDLRFEVFRKGSQIVPGKGTPVPILVIGNELGLLNAPAVPILDTPVGGVRPGTPNVLPIGPGERYDVIADFSNVPVGSRVVVTNSAKSPYPDAVRPANKLLDRIMAFDVVKPLNQMIPDASVTLGTDLRTTDLPPATIPPGTPTRRILLFEGLDGFGRLMTMIGTVDADPNTGQQGTLTFKDPITERPKVGTTEIWEFYNTTVDAHPVHMHLVDFRVLDRQAFTGTLTPKTNSDGSTGAILDPVSIVKTGTPLPANPWEAGRKDTVRAFPGEVTRVLVSFNREGEYVYHCHILSHEDHEMMRPYEVVAEQVAGQ